MTHVAEIVTFALVPNTSDAAFLAAAKGTEAFTRAQPGFVKRELSKGEDGTWTDYVLWSSPEAAKAAGEAFMRAECAGAMMQVIAPDSVRMRHQAVHWTMAA